MHVWYFLYFRPSCVLFIKYRYVYVYRKTVPFLSVLIHVYMIQSVLLILDYSIIKCNKLKIKMKQIRIRILKRFSSSNKLAFLVHVTDLDNLLEHSEIIH